MATSNYAQALDSLAARMAAAGRAPLGYRANGRPIWPIFGAEDDPANPTPPPAVDPPAPTDPGFPANTPLEQMSVEQREAYWKHQSRKHEDRAKAFKDLTPEKLAELREKADRHDALELELGTTADKAAAKAADEAKAAARAEVQPQIVAARLDAAAARAGVSEEDLARAVEFVDSSKFLAADGTVDTDKVKAFVETIKPAKGTSGPPPKGPTFTGHGTGSGGSTTTGSGSELYDRLHPKKSA